MTETKCIFCDRASRALVGENGLAAAFRDAFPVSEGHTLIVPKRHAATFLDLTEEEMRAVFALARECAETLRAGDGTIAGFNFGANAGACAGQTVFHCHFHLIPRRSGDHPHPRGGVRAVIPGKAEY
jgi:diadenosine tetraphosphate (Ap4A) HIT family hydrolase